MRPGLHDGRRQECPQQATRRSPRRPVAGEHALNIEGKEGHRRRSECLRSRRTETDHAGRSIHRSRPRQPPSDRRPPGSLAQPASPAPRGGGALHSPGHSSAGSSRRTKPITRRRGRSHPTASTIGEPVAPDGSGPLLNPYPCTHVHGSVVSQRPRRHSSAIRAVSPGSGRRTADRESHLMHQGRHEKHGGSGKRGTGIASKNSDKQTAFEVIGRRRVRRAAGRRGPLRHGRPEAHSTRNHQRPSPVAATD